MDSRPDGSVGPTVYARTVAVSLIVSVAMMVPMQLVVSADSVGWRAGLIAVALLLGFYGCRLLAPMGLGSGEAVGAVLAPVTAIMTILEWIGVLVVSDLGVEPYTGIVIGLSAAAISAALSAPVVADADDISMAASFGLLAVGFGIAFGLGTFANGALM